MESVCPNCQKKNEHEDFLFEVVCKCGSRYNPFMQLEDPNGLGAEPSAMSENAAAGADNFAESSATFQELRDFGENLGQSEAGVSPGVSEGTPKEAPVASAAPKARPAPTVAVNVEPGEECPMTAGDGLPGYVIEAYYLPVSVVCDVEMGGDNPLRNAFSALWQSARGAGGNGVVSLRWSLTPDGAKVVASGTPVKCARS